MFIYDYITYEGQNLILNENGRYYFLNINTENEFLELDFDDYGWIFEKGESAVNLILGITSVEDANMPYLINFTVEKGGDKSLVIFNQIVSDEEVEVNFLGIVGGQIIKFKTMKFKISETVLKQIKG